MSKKQFAGITTSLQVILGVILGLAIHIYFPAEPALFGPIPFSGSLILAMLAIGVIHPIILAFRKD